MSDALATDVTGRAAAPATALPGGDATLPPHRRPLAPGLSEAQLLALLEERFGLVRDQRDRWQLCCLCPGEQLHQVVRFLRDAEQLRFDTLLDVAGIDYLAYPDYRGPRFAVTYLFKSTVYRHRLLLKVLVEEHEAAVPSLVDLYHIADWAERETWDQFGIVFTGHPNLRRLLNHHEFIGHPLRKDYPCQKRQKLSTNDPMVDQLEARLRHLGYQVIDPGEAHRGERIARPHGAAAAQGQVDDRPHPEGSIDAGGLR
jgi:NADH-quinone oxidoreductase subunit C